MEPLQQRLNSAKNYLEKSIGKSAIRIGLILGSGLGEISEMIENPITFFSGEVPYFPSPTVSGHEGKLVFGMIGPVSIIAVKGRVHYYEGYPMSEVTFSTRLAAMMGIKILIVTNASGGINPEFKTGDLILITDHINLFFKNPLVEPMTDRWNFRYLQNGFYDAGLGCIAEDSALQLGIRLKRGVLVGSPGPSYETSAEIQMIRHLGADCVSMSMVPEVIIARQMGIRVVGISCITNLATGIGREPLSHRDVTAVATTVKDPFVKLLSTIISQIPNEVKN